MANMNFQQSVAGGLRFASKDVKPNMLLFNSKIPDMHRELEMHYVCLSDPDLIPSMSFDDFIRHRAIKLFDGLLRAVEEETDRALHKRP